MTRHRWLPAAMLCICAALGAGGCATGTGKSPTQQPLTGVTKEETGEGTGKITNLTAEQKAFLLRVSMDEARVRSGDLTSAQAAILKQHDAAMEYMNRKYPSHEFEFMDYIQSGIANGSTCFLVEADGDPLFLYEVQVGDDEDEPFADDYFCTLLKSDYENLLLPLLQEGVPECACVDVRISTLKGEEFGEDFDMGRVISGEVQLSNTATVYLDGSDSEARDLIDLLREHIADEEIYGAYIAVVLDGIPPELKTPEEFQDYAAGEDGSRVLLRDHFQQFE